MISIKRFRQTIYDYYNKNKRNFPWRETTNPYHILVSEIMLQQTQTSRVQGKYENFIREFPDFKTLYHAKIRKILAVWQGLGYNRRAVALHKIAQIVIKDFNGHLPQTTQALDKLPGIGPSTASAIVAFAYNKPTVFIETNIRTVYCHFFFSELDKVNDHDILDRVSQTLDTSNVRDWYYALFDYGVMLKQKENLSQKSAHYRKQSPYKGSNREVRSKIIRLLLSSPPMSNREIDQSLNINPGQSRDNLIQLQREGLLTKVKGKFTIA